MASSGVDRIYFQFKDITERNYFVEFYRDSPTTSIEIEKGATDPVTIKHLGASKGESDFTNIIGQEMTFRFYLHRNDLIVLDDMMESSYQEWNARFKILDPITIILFQGYLKPENIIRRYEIDPPYIEVELSATDGLAELKEIDFIEPLATQDVFTGEILLIQAIKTAVEFTGIALPFKINCNTYEVLHMTSSQCLFTNIYCNDERFYDTGKEDALHRKDAKRYSCWDVLEMILKPFNCKLIQTGEYYYIINYNEINSYFYIYNWDLTLNTDKTAASITIDISDYQFVPYVELQKIAPLKSLRAIIDNNDNGNEIVDFNDWATNWDYFGWDSNTVTTEGYAELSMTSCPGSLPYMVTNQSIAVIKDASTVQYLRVMFSFRLTAYAKQMLDYDALRIAVRIKKDDTWTDYIISKDAPPLNSIGAQAWRTFDSGANYFFKITQTGNYTVEIKLLGVPLFHWNSLTLQIKDILVSQWNILDNTTIDPTLREVSREFYQENTDGFEDKEINLSLFDATTKSDDAALLAKVGGIIHITSNWNVSGDYGGCSIADLCLRTILMNNAYYKNFIRCSFVDRNHNVFFERIVIIDSKYYIFNSYQRDYRLGIVEGELEEIIPYSSAIDVYDYAEEVTDTNKATSYTLPAIELNEYDYVNTGTQIDHGFDRGDVIRKDVNDGIYYKAQADTLDNAKVLGIVSDVISSNVFIYKTEGYIGKELMAGKLTFVEGESYFLSPTEAGGILKSASIPTGIKVPVGIGTELGFKVDINPNPTLSHNYLEGLQGGKSPDSDSDSSGESSGETDGEYYHHTEDEYDTHVYEAPIDGNMYAREDGEWVEVTNEFETVTDMSVVGDGTASNPVVLAFDEELPGSNKVYGTDGGGIKGWKPDPTVDSVEFTSIEEDSSTTLPAVTNTNNIVRLIIGRTSALPDLTADLGGMAAMKCWNGSTAEYNNIDSDDIDDDTYYFLTE